MSFTCCISIINNTQIDDAQYIDVVISWYNLIEYSDNYSKASGILWQYCRDVRVVNNDGALFISLKLMLLLIRLFSKKN